MRKIVESLFGAYGVFVIMLGKCLVYLPMLVIVYDGGYAMYLYYVVQVITYSNLYAGLHI